MGLKFIEFTGGFLQGLWFLLGFIRAGRQFMGFGRFLGAPALGSYAQIRGFRVCWAPDVKSLARF